MMDSALLTSWVKGKHFVSSLKHWVELLDKIIKDKIIKVKKMNLVPLYYAMEFLIYFPIFLFIPDNRKKISLANSSELSP